MSEPVGGRVPGADATVITVEDLKRKATHIADLTEAEVRAVSRQPMTRYVAVGAVAVLLAVSVAYYVGVKRGRRRV